MDVWCEYVSVVNCVLLVCMMVRAIAAERWFAFLKLYLLHLWYLAESA